MSDEIGLNTGPLAADRDTIAAGIDAIPSTLADRAIGDFEANPTASIGRLLGRTFATTGVDPVSGVYSMPPETPMPAAEAQSKYGIPDQLKFDNDVPEDVAKSLYDAKRAELARQDVMRRQPSGFFNGLAGLGTDFLVGSLDPLNAAASFIPVVGEARYAGWLARAGESVIARAGVRAGVGAAQGVAATAPIVGFQYALSKQEQGDMSATDALLSLAYGGILGGGLHTSVGSFADLIHGVPRAAIPEAQAIDAAPPATIVEVGGLRQAASKYRGKPKRSVRTSATC
jgi:hypothetical protein